MPIVREDVIFCLNARVAREPALGVVRLRRFVSHGAGPERIGCRVIVEHGVPPPAAVREPLAILHHEVDVMLGSWYGREGECFRVARESQVQIQQKLRFPPLDHAPNLQASPAVWRGGGSWGFIAL